MSLAVQGQIEPGRFQRRHRMLLMAGVLSALFLLPAWPAAAAMLGLTTAYAATLGRSLWLRLASALLAAGLVLAALTAASGPNVAWWQALAALYFPLVIAVLNLGHLGRVPGLVAKGLRGAVVVLLAAMLFAVAGWHFPIDWPVLLMLAPTLLGLSLALLERRRLAWLERPPRRQASLSVLLVCKNEIDRIDECLGRVAGWADEIVVLDSGSTDGTLERVRQYTDQVWQTDWPGYGRQKQRALERCTGDWVLNIDADEFVTDELRREIDARLANPGRTRVFRIAWVSCVFGGLVYFGADGRYHKRLFLREGARFNDADVHEDVVVEGKPETLGAPVCHDTFRDYAHLRAKFTDYSLISARAMHRRGRRAGPLKASLRGIGSFLLLYFRRMGLLDGRRGLLMAWVYATYTFDKYAALWSMRINSAPGGAEKDASQS